MTAVLVIMLLWFLVWAAIAWHGVQDDAFIHLRYADHLLRYHFITYNGVERDYGASSLLYVFLLAFLRLFTRSADLPHIVSTALHAALLTVPVIFLVRRFPCKAVQARRLAWLLLLVLITPSAFRWFEDGMETGLTTLLAILFAALLHRVSQSEIVSPRDLLALAGLGCITVVHRVELGTLAAIGSLIIISAPQMRDRFKTHIGASIALIAGAGLAAAIIFATMHSLLPDTALAKGGNGSSNWLPTFRDTVTVLAGGGSVGAGLAIFWGISLTTVSLYTKPALRTWLANATFPLIVCLSGYRGQQIQGARYLIWTFAFPIIWNILEVQRAEADQDPPEGAKRRQAATKLSAAFAVLLLLCIPYEAKVMYRILHQRALTEQAFSSASLSQIHALRGVAYDVGYIGYFTDSPICDLAGLVNGRHSALLVTQGRASACADFTPHFMFGDGEQVDFFGRYFPMKDWKLCGTYDLMNIRSSSRHYLIASPETAPEVCTAVARNTGHD